ncbi:MAG TPA: hypothetical protein VEA16_19070 [Vicinamibacterales bacterium]|nr:hypothetical protein [Vicinamibacterales bacterium]
MNLEEKAREILERSEAADHEATEVLLTVKEYAALYGLHEQTVYTAIRYGRRLNGRVERPTSHAIRIAVPRESIKTLKSA